MITGERYLKWDYGPVPRDFSQAKNELIQEGKIREYEKSLGKDYKKYTYKSLDKVDTSIFDEDEIDCITKTLEKLGNMTASQISVYSHGDMPWQAACDNEEIEPEFVFYRDPEYCMMNYEE